MNERQIQNSLWDRLRQMGHSLVVPNYTPVGWFECDMFSITKAGMMVEHEIKLSVPDFRKDAEKFKNEWNGKHGPDFAYDKRGKHERLLASDQEGPSRFFYVVPNEMVRVEDVPVFAGLMYFEAFDKYKRPRTFLVVKDAPKLHSGKVDPKVAKHALGVMYWRYWHLRTRIKPDDARLEENDEIQVSLEVEP